MGCPTLLARSATTGSCSETSLELFVPWHWREKGTSWARSTWIPAGPRDPGDLGDPIAHPSIDFGIFNLAWSKGRPGGSRTGLGLSLLSLFETVKTRILCLRQEKATRAFLGVHTQD